MIFFQLMVYSCVSAAGIDGELLSKTCDWRPWDFYVYEQVCEWAGGALIGKPIFSDVYEDRKIENTKCIQLSAVK